MEDHWNSPVYAFKWTIKLYRRRHKDRRNSVHNTGIWGGSNAIIRRIAKGENGSTRFASNLVRIAHQSKWDVAQTSSFDSVALTLKYLLES